MPEMFSLIVDDPVLLPILIFFARITDVSVGTVRLICVTRGRRALAVGLGFLEVLIWVSAMSATFSQLDRWVNILAFAAGFSVGNAVGMWIEQRLAMGVQILQFISKGRAEEIARRLRESNLRVTQLAGTGRDGPVTINMSIVPRRWAPGAIRSAREIDPGVIITVEDASATLWGESTSGAAGRFRFFAGLRPGRFLRRAGRVENMAGPVVVLPEGDPRLEVATASAEPA